MTDHSRSDESEFWAEADRSDEDSRDLAGALSWGALTALAVAVAQAVRDFVKDRRNN